MTKVTGVVDGGRKIVYKQFNMRYKVIPFIATLNQKKAFAEHAAEQLEQIIRKNSDEGWQYVRLESITTWVAPENGCFGLGAKPGYMTSKQVIVFEAND